MGERGGSGDGVDVTPGLGLEFPGANEDAGAFLDRSREIPERKIDRVGRGDELEFPPEILLRDRTDPWRPSERRGKDAIGELENLSVGLHGPGRGELARDLIVTALFPRDKDTHSLKLELSHRIEGQPGAAADEDEDGIEALA